MKSICSNGSLRSAAALTHPATLAAVVVLLVNDTVLKPAWPEAWVTGKLSDLAWLIFASPLLALLLSPLAKRVSWGERAAFVIAYVGLPLLYAAFNTFAALHDAIITVLSVASSGKSGSPLDPTDSLVIPFSLSIAVWVWRRSAIDADRLRTRLVLLAAGVATLATVATSEEAPDFGITHVWAGSDESVLASQFPRHPFASYDGGFTWVSGPSYQGSQAPEVIKDVGTPRGTYSLDGTDIVRTVGEQRVVAYSAAYLQEESNIRVRRLARTWVAHDEITTEPYAIAYDPSSLVSRK